MVTPSVNKKLMPNLWREGVWYGGVLMNSAGEKVAADNTERFIRRYFGRTALLLITF